MAPFLFLFFVEAMISFLNANDIGLRGLYIPFSNVELREVEFADDTTIYLQGDLDNFQKTEMSLTTFYKASGALVNWNKSMAFWVGNEDPMESTPAISMDSARYPNSVPRFYNRY